MKKIAFLAAVATAATAYAQDITTEVVVDRTAAPVERAATRPTRLVPSVTLPAVEPVQLSTANYSLLSPIERSFTILQPPAGVATPVASPYRGYVTAAYGPSYNLSVIAGYRALATDNATLDVHADFDGFSHCDPNYDARQIYNAFAIGADYALRVNDYSRLNASVGYSLSSSAHMTRHSQSRNVGHLDLGWSSSVEGLDYEAWFLGEFNASSDVEFKVPGDYHYDGLKQQRFAIGGKATLPFDETYGFGVALRGDFIHSSVDKNLGKSSTPGIFSVRPFVELSTDDITATAGLNFDFFTSVNAKMYLSPQVEITWRPDEIIALSAKATGGTGFNTIDDVLDICPLAGFIMPYDRYRLPFDIEGSFVAGPVSGVAITVSGGYAKAENLVTAGIGDLMSLSNVKGWHGKVAAEYSHRLWGINTSIAFAQSGDGKGYYQWRDGARMVFTAGGHIIPVEGLKVALDYQFRDRRHVAQYNLGCVSNLSLRGDYTFNDRIDFFALGDNILSRRYQMTGGIFSQGIVVMVGANYKF
ncbi:MAG: hypothetical protein ACI30X_03270 [Muribaculaceae bacterium]